MVRYFICLGFLFSAMAFADVASDLTKAYELFKKRDQGLSHIEQSKSIYLSLLKDKNNTLAVKREALDKYGRLSMFQGEIGHSLYNLSESELTSIFDQCVEASDHLSPELVGDTPEYAYWRSWCMIMWAKNASKMKLLKRGVSLVTEFHQLVDMGQAKFPDFDSFGFERILAGVYSYGPILRMFGLYQPERSLKLVNDLLARPTNYYSDYIIKAKALDLLNRHGEAQGALKEGIAELEVKLAFGKIPEIVLADNKMFLKTMRSLIK